jgi:16S rRNA (guanine966-N2)-methyltransferase
MTEKVREAVFASLGSQGVIEGARVVDLFAGTGAIGIEALSRGAREAVFVEADPAAAATVEANLALTGLPGGSLVRDDVLRYLARRPERFDVAFADPPFRFDDWQSLLSRLPADIAVVESTAAIDPGADWMLTGTRRYGGSVVTFLHQPSIPQPGKD